MRFWTIPLLTFYPILNAFALIPEEMPRGSASQENFEIEATWVGASQWITGVDNGYETFNGSIAKGVDFYGTSVQTGQYVPVEVRFESDSSNWTKVQVFRRELFYDAAGVGTFPGTAWDMSVPSNPRRLNLCTVEFDDPDDIIPPPNFRWDPDTSQYGKYEFLFIMNSSYDGSGSTYQNINILADESDVLYAWWPRVAGGHTFFETESAVLKIFPFMNFSATQISTRADLTWFSPGPIPDHFGVFWSLSPPADSLIAIVAGSVNGFTHQNVGFEEIQYYQIKSFDTADNEIIMSHEIAATIVPTAPVIGIFPRAHAVSVNPHTEISVSFVLEMDPLSFNDTTFRVFGRWSGPSTGTFSFVNIDSTVTFHPDNDFFAGDLITVSLSRGIKSNTGDSMTTGYSWSFWTKTKPASLLLNKIGEISTKNVGEGPIRPNSANAGDFNHDGWSDLAVICGGSDDIRVFLNNGTGHYDSNFTTYPFSGGGEISRNVGADFNADGVIDLAVAASNSNMVKIAYGGGNGGFLSPSNFQTGTNVQGIGLVDANEDGFEDLFTASLGDFGSGIANSLDLMLNSGNGSFPTYQALNNPQTDPGVVMCASSDVNNDGHGDVPYCSPTGALASKLGNGFGGFSLYPTWPFIGSSTMMEAGDVNGDGKVDIVSCNYPHHSVSVAIGDGTGRFLFDEAYASGRYPQSIHLGDLDGDGDLDMVSTSLSSKKISVFENDGYGNFTRKQEYPTLGQPIYVVLHDRDNDGDLDMTAIDQQDEIVILYENNCCTGMRGDLNGDGVDADISDLTFLVDYIFRSSGNYGTCRVELDVNGDGLAVPNILDLTYIVDYLFRSGPAPAGC